MISEKSSENLFSTLYCITKITKFSVKFHKTSQNIIIVVRQSQM